MPSVQHDVTRRNTPAPPPAAEDGAPPVLCELLASAGVRFNGSDPWDIQVRDPQFYQRILNRGSLGFGEAYVDGLWESHQLDELFTRLLRADINEKIRSLTRARLAGEVIRNLVLNRQSRRKAFEVARKHYDIGNDIYQAMLDTTMSYSCGYWAETDDLESAQFAKLEMICKKLELKPGEHLLDIGCGWGGLAAHAARHHGVEVTGITISLEQQKLARKRCAGLPVRIELMDYRNLTGKFDKIASVGMFEHVGPRNYRRFFAHVRELMKADGLFLLHTIGSDRTSRCTDPWIDRYIFPNGHIPSASQITKAMEGKLLIEDWHNFGSDYDRTLMAWWKNFDHAWPRLKGQYDERFYRMWKYYLHACAGLFRSRQGQLWQLVLTRRDRKPVYRSFRPDKAWMTESLRQSQQ